MIQDRAMVTGIRIQETVPKLSNGTIFNDLERLPIQMSRSRYLFGADYLRNGTRYNGILIGTYIRPTQRCHSFRIILSDLDWQRTIQRHGASRGLSATAELLIFVKR